MCVSLYVFLYSDGFRLLCRTRSVMNTDDATFNSMQLFFIRFNFLFLFFCFTHMWDFENEENC
jgi:hypothetical protein